MNSKITIKLFTIMLAGALMSSFAFACDIQTRNQHSFLVGDIIEFGDLKIKVVRDTDESGSTPVMVDIKAPGYIKRKITIPVLGLFTDQICGKTVNIAVKSRVDLSVSISDF